MNKRDLALAAGAILLLAVAVVRLAVPDRSRIRPISIESFEVQSARIDPGQTITRETDWSPPNDVYLMGWNPWIGAPVDAKLEVEMMLYHGPSKTTIFITGHRVVPPASVDAWRFFSLPPDTGFRVPKGETLTFRYRVTNAGAASFETKGATALIYFVPVEGN